MLRVIAIVAFFTGLTSAVLVASVQPAYAGCPSGYSAEGSYCVARCPGGYHRSGGYCVR